MASFVFLLVLSIGLQVGASNLDDAFKAFLTPSSTFRSSRDNGIAVNHMFKLFEDEFKRPSMTLIEEKLRFKAFNHTLFALLKDYQQGGKTYTVGLNEYADWTPTELNQLRGVRVPEGEIQHTNLKPNQLILPLTGRKAQSRSNTLPSSFDFTELVVSGTNTPIVRPIKHQGQCGSCYSFAFVALLEALYAFELKSSEDLSEQQMVDCSPLDHGCGGGYFTNTFQYLNSNAWQAEGGITYPYEGQAGNCAFRSGVSGIQFAQLAYADVQNNDVGMQEALTTYGPLYVSLFVGDDTTATYQSITSIFQQYTDGVIEVSGCPTLVHQTNHAVVIVGYGVDEATGVPYWKVRNSWGEYWGENGYFRIRRGVNMCGIESRAFFMGRAS